MPPKPLKKKVVISIVIKLRFPALHLGLDFVNAFD